MNSALIEPALKFMDMKKRFLLFLLCAFVFTASAERVGREKAMSVAKAFIAGKSNQPLRKGSDNDITLKEVAQTLNFNNFYIFNYENGFVIISADDRANPVLAYSNEAPFNVNGTPSNIIEWLRGYENEIKDVIDRDLKSSPEIKREWDRLLDGKLPEAKSRAFVQPLVHTHWDQMEPYNALCPEATCTGCVATAMAQVMKYWEHPYKGTGSHSYYHSTFGTQYANFGNTVYDWDNMPDNCTSSSSTAEKTAVATLMYHCGVSVDMNYGPATTGGSGAYSEDVPTALKNYFSYSSSTSIAYKWSYTSTQWIDLLKSELNASRPLYYSGADLSVMSGHAFVCDGYDEYDFFHFNWGWSGYCDAYYQIGALNPGPGGAGSGSSGMYNDQNAIIINCEPISSIAAPTNLSAVVEGQDVLLEWSSVSGATSYYLYKDNVKIAVLSSCSYTDNNVSYGSHSYYVKSVASNGNTSKPSNIANVSVVFPGPAPYDLAASVMGRIANLTWNAPSPETASLKYGDANLNNYVSSYGYGGSSATYWGQRYPKEKLVNYAGMAINKFQVPLEAGTYTFYIYKGNSVGATEKMYEKSVTVSGNWSVRTINIDSPVAIDYTSDLWVIMCAPATITYPADYCLYSGEGAADACYISKSVSSWSSVSSAGNYSWMMETSITDGTYTYNLYRDDTKIASNLNTKSYTDSDLPLGTYQYHVKTNYYGGESAASNIITVAITDGTQYDVTTTAYPTNGGTTTGDGAFYNGQSCTVTATPATNYQFVNWTDEDGNQVSTSASYTFTVNGNISLTANFELKQYDITTTANPTNGGTTTGDGTFTYGQSCTVTAMPATGYQFVNWTDEDGNQVSTSASYTFTVNGNISLTANFELKQYDVTTASNPTNGGTTTGDGTFTYGQSCTVTATPATGYQFVKWTKNGSQVSTDAEYTFEVTESVNLVANFQPIQYEVTATANPTNGGTITGDGTFDYGQNCTVTATPATGYQFVKWTKNGSQVSTEAEYTFEVTEDVDLIANFELKTFTISVSVNPEDGGTAFGAGEYEYGETVTLYVEPNTHYFFENWSEDGAVVSTDEEYTFTVESDRTIEVNLYYFNSVGKENETNINVYPNPVDGQLTIQLANDVKMKSITIYNIDGRQIYAVNEADCDGSTVTINTNEISSGLYIVKMMSSEDKVFIKKVIVKH